MLRGPKHSSSRQHSGARRFRWASVPAKGVAVAFARAFPISDFSLESGLKLKRAKVGTLLFTSVLWVESFNANVIIRLAVHLPLLITFQLDEKNQLHRAPSVQHFRFLHKPKTKILSKQSPGFPEQNVRIQASGPGFVIHFEPRVPTESYLLSRPARPVPFKSPAFTSQAPEDTKRIARTRTLNPEP